MYWPVYTNGSDMGGFLFLLLVFQVIYGNLAITCPPREYNINNICCPMCDKGLFVKAHCTSSSSSSVCVLCADGTFMDHPNGLTECFRCKPCDTGAGLIVKEECTTTSDTVCGCKDGLYCPNQDCDVCQEHTQCQPGQYVKKPGTDRSDSVCEDCPAEHFSNETNSVLCFPWKTCSESGLLLHQKGTTTTDSICKEKRSYVATIVSFLLTGIIVGIFVFLQKVLKKLSNKEANVPEEVPYPLSKQEEGADGSQLNLSSRQKSVVKS